MATQTPTKQSLFQALTSTFRRARTSLYQPFTGPQPAAEPIPIPGPPMAKILPFRIPPPLPEPIPEPLPAISSHRSAPTPPSQSLHIFLPRTATAFAMYD
jgi:hypothetical protein